MSLNKSRLRYVALLLMIPAAVLGATTLFTPNFNSIVAHGPIQLGHSELACADCHWDSTGTVRQQVQANVAFALGNRATAVDFGYQVVTSAQCLHCHERPNERHPIYRFNEPRFAEVRQDINANSCLGCHTEHQDARVSVTNTVCSHCHQDLKLSNDPLDIAHEQLVEDKHWDTCLGCHDFHGNHAHKAQSHVSEAFNVGVIRSYFKNGDNPYGSEKHYKAKTND